MSSRFVSDTSTTEAMDTSLRYLTTIDGCPLLWDDRAGCPVWPEGEPTQVGYELDGSVTIEPRCDVYRAWWGLPGRRLDCSHVVSAPSHYLTWLADGRDTCLTCGEGR